MTTIKERPILFSGAMVRALLAGTKTQTRRAVGLDFINENPGCWQVQWVPAKDGKHWLFTCGDDRVQLACPYGVEGERLWVREHMIKNLNTGTYWPAADGYKRSISEETGKPFAHEKSVPSIFMPRAASRLLLEIVTVRVERVQSISEADALAEGATQGILRPYGRNDWQLEHNIHSTYKEGFQYVWYTVNSPESWAANPFVWVVEFKVIEGGKEVASA